jgi:hypothetical protein
MDTVPDTVDLAERAALSLNALGGCLDPDLLTMYFVCFFNFRTPRMEHRGSADTTCDPKFLESFPLMRVMCGSDQYDELESRFRAELLSRVDHGLYWDRYDPRRPWRKVYNPHYTGYDTEGKDEDCSGVVATARMMRALAVWQEATGDDSLDSLRGEMLQSMSRIMIRNDDYGYYPEKGGWAEPCTYPRSGWLNTDEPETETQGAEGSMVSYHGHQMYAAVQWYDKSGDPEALDLAARLARFTMKPKFWGGVPDLEGDPTTVVPHTTVGKDGPPYTADYEQGHWFSHFHARSIALRGLLEFGRAAEDDRVLEFVRRSYEFSLTQGIPRLGWINCFPDRADMCEGCALGDLAAFGVRLSDLGVGDYWDDVDALTRNHLVEGQFTDAEVLTRIAAASEEHSSLDSSDPTIAQAQITAEATEAQLAGQGAAAAKVTTENVLARGLGSFAGVSQPYSIPGAWVMHCCTGNATQGLYYAWEGIVREAGDTAQVNLLLNRAAKLLDVHSYLPYAGKVVLRNKGARRISVRIPAWVPSQTVRAEVAGVEVPLEWVGRYLVFSGLRPGDDVTLTFPVKERTYTYTINARSKHEQVITCTFRGSTCVDVSPHDEAPTSYPLYQRAHLRTTTAPMKQVERFVAARKILNW